jgi:nitroreductase
MSDLMELKDLFLKTRSYRRFYEDVQVPDSVLQHCIETLRLAPSVKNLQHYKFHLINDPETCALVFPHLQWAGFLKDWEGPEKGERPAAYIIQLLDQDISRQSYGDQGIAALSIVLAAAEKDFGACIIAAVNRTELSSALKYPEKYEIIYVIAIGKARESILIEKVKNNDTRYYRDEKGRHHVPKRSVEELIIKNPLK